MFEIEESSPAPTTQDRRSTIPPPPPAPPTPSRTLALCRGGARLTLLLSLLVYGWAKFSNESYPAKSDIESSLLKPPLQEPTERETFDFSYAGENYTVEPVAEYELSGLVVSFNNPSGWGDIYHDEKSVDFRDLCVVWGANADPKLLERMRFWSAPWTCFMRANDQRAQGSFNPDALSNNHLLTDQDSVRQTIERAQIGDQIHLSGMLVNYYPRGLKAYSRKSSTVRTDTGNGACEVLFVEAAQLLRKGPRTRYRLLNFSTWGLVLSVGTQLALFFFAPLEKRR